MHKNDFLLYINVEVLVLVSVPGKAHRIQLSETELTEGKFEKKILNQFIDLLNKV